MKKLAFIFSIVAFSLNAQVNVGKCKSFYEDKILAKQIFDSINSYRKSLGQGAFIWEENYYVTAKTHNDYLAKNGLWGHRNNWQPGTELIVAVNNLREPVTSALYSMIADSCLRQWKHSAPHNQALKSPLLTKTETGYSTTWDGVTFNATRSKYGAISVNVVDYGNVKHVSCILHLGYYTDPNLELQK